MKLLLGLCLAAAAFAQGTSYDCYSVHTFSGAGVQASQNNASAQSPCVAWRITYTSTGFSSVTVKFQTSPDDLNWSDITNSICSSSVQPPCVTDGANPLTAGVMGSSAFRAYGKFVRVNVTSVTGTGSGQVVTYGYKGTSASASTGGGGGSGPTDNQNIRTVAVTFDGGGVALSGSATRCVPIVPTGALATVRLQACNAYTSNVCSSAGTATIDIRTASNSSYASTGPSAAATIKSTGSLLAISSAYAVDGDLTNWTLSGFGGQTACIVMTSPTAMTVDVVMGIVVN